MAGRSLYYSLWFSGLGVARSSGVNRRALRRRPSLLAKAARRVACHAHRRIRTTYEPTRTHIDMRGGPAGAPQAGGRGERRRRTPFPKIVNYISVLPRSVPAAACSTHNHPRYPPSRIITTHPRSEDSLPSCTRCSAKHKPTLQTERRHVLNSHTIDSQSTLCSHIQLRHRLSSGHSLPTNDSRPGQLS